MPGLRGMAAGALALIALEAVVSSDPATGRVAGIFAGVATAAERFLDPGVPAIPDHSKKPGAQATPASFTAGAAAAPVAAVMPGALPSISPLPGAASAGAAVASALAGPT